MSIIVLHFPGQNEIFFQITKKDIQRTGLSRKFAMTRSFRVRFENRTRPDKSRRRQASVTTVIFNVFAVGL